ncbi:conserved hypothetical protein [Prochlorococcus marinus str. MIT 9515]|uniref:Uncharacterized protein n=1 Tax=Prochlorococcus marinus (strain MIT 9515) TaxID=167542 RepID=A2BU23_PROM5|nr:hypothetical protein [Prochlorococcus marinus]ABM71284.1 conserved hypothetical protein [Prochlorococcus marinus str. MIT 9515]
MKTPESLNSKPNNFLNLIIENWEGLEDSQKSVLIKIWKVLTYKWQLQILFNLPFLIWWLMDISILKVHEFDLRLLSYLNLPDWALSLIGFGQSSS